MAGSIKLKDANGFIVSIDPSAGTEDRTFTTNQLMGVSTVASSVLLNPSSLALDTTETKNFAAVTYTGTGDNQDIVTKPETTVLT